MAVDLTLRADKGAPLTWEEIDANFQRLANSIKPARFAFKADAQSQNPSDPGTGKLRWNADPQRDATALYFDWITDDGFDLLLFLKITDIGNRIAIQDADFALNYQIWESSGVIKHPDFFEAPVTLLETSGAGSFSHNTRLVMLMR